MSVLSDYATCPVTEWQKECVAVFKNGDIIRGEYDGYGRIETDHSEFELEYGREFMLFHRACWEAAGRPTEFTEEAKGAADQGFFFDDKSHDFAPPGTPNPEEWVQERKVQRYVVRQQQELNKMDMEWYDIFYANGVLE